MHTVTFPERRAASGQQRHKVIRSVQCRLGYTGTLELGPLSHVQLVPVLLQRGRRLVDRIFVGLHGEQRVLHDVRGHLQSYYLRVTDVMETEEMRKWMMLRCFGYQQVMLGFAMCYISNQGRYIC